MQPTHKFSRSFTRADDEVPPLARTHRELRQLRGRDL